MQLTSASDHLSRRGFLSRSMTVGALATLPMKQSMAGAASDSPTIALIGCGGRSKSLVKGFRDAARFAWTCDPDQKRAEELKRATGAKQSTSDLRRVLDDSAVDAVIIATPDHWHAPAAIMACAAGKHVYVEKPCSHNLLEGRLLVDAARRHQVVIQHGTQSRTNPLIVRAIELLRSGTIGEVLTARAWNIQRRKDIGRQKPSEPPAHLDYDTWVGPAQWMPYQENRLHYDWHWWHNFGTGDIGNDGTHELDIARWGLGVNGLPSKVAALGGKYLYDDDQQFPDTASCVFEWPGVNDKTPPRQLTFQMQLWSRNYPHNCDTGVEFYGTQGMLFVSKRGKLELRDDRNKVIGDSLPELQQALPRNHQVDFLEAIRDGKSPAAEIEIGHHSTALVHLANAALRSSPGLQVDPATEQILNDPAAQVLLRREYREAGHWSIPQGAMQ